MKLQDSSRPSTRGRPRAFDRTEALDRAMRVFWDRGFEAASTNDLTKAMGIRSPSLYAAFGDKGRLFLEAIDHYQHRSVGSVREALSQTSTREAVGALLDGAADRFAGHANPTGCFVVLSGLALDPIAHPELATKLANERQGFERAIDARLELGREVGDLPADADCAALARYVVMIYQALAVGARQGQSSRQLRASALQALEGWPSEPEMKRPTVNTDRRCRRAR